jgi:hypothetical protein
MMPQQVDGLRLSDGRNFASLAEMRSWLSIEWASLRGARWHRDPCRATRGERRIHGPHGSAARGLVPGRASAPRLWRDSSQACSDEEMGDSTHSSTLATLLDTVKDTWYR